MNSKTMKDLIPSNLTDLESALLHLEADSKLLRQLETITGEVNIFSVLGIADKELKHSAFLAWLLNPSANHGLGCAFLRNFLFTLLDRSASKGILLKRIVSEDTFADCQVFREIDNIDLLLVFKSSRCVVCIENKVGIKEHDNQLHRYYTRVKKRYSDQNGWVSMFVFLTPDGVSPENINDAKKWINLSYRELVHITDSLATSNETRPAVQSLLKQYSSTIRSFAMEDNQLNELCRTIYRKHKMAIDILFDHRNDAQKNRYDACVEWCETKARDQSIQYNAAFSTARIIRFTTLALNSVFPLLQSSESLWGNEHTAFYEIENNKDNVFMKIVVSTKGLVLKSREEAAIKYFLELPKKGKGKRAKYISGKETYYSIWTGEKLRMNVDFTDDDEAKIHEHLDKSLGALEAVLQRYLDNRKGE